MSFTFYWHDYETFGVDPRADRPAQFAGLRTDAELNPVEPPLELYCRLSPDYLPHPEACALTGIGPATAKHAENSAPQRNVAKLLRVVV